MQLKEIKNKIKNIIGKSNDKNVGTVGSSSGSISNGLDNLINNDGTKRMYHTSDEELQIESNSIIRPEKKGTRVNRVSLDKLEKLYYMEPLLFAGVNFYVSQVVGPEFEITGMGSKQATNEVRDFFDKVSINFTLSKVMQDLCVYGNAYVHLIRDKNDEIISLETVDPKSMKFIENRDSEVLTDKFNDPIGYIQNASTIDTQRSIKDVLEEKGYSPENISFKNKNGIAFPSEDIAHFKLNSLSDTMMGVGIIEPVYDTVMLKLQTEESLGHSLEQTGFPTYKAKLGEEGVHEPTQDELKTFDEDVLSNLESSDSITLPYYYEIGTVESGDPERLNQYLDYFEEQIVSGLGIPHSILTKGDRIGTGVVDIGVDRIEKRITIYQKRLAEMIREEILVPFVKQFDIKANNTPKLLFKTVSPQSLTEKADRISELADKGIIVPDDELEAWIRDLENLPQSSENRESREKKRENAIKNKSENKNKKVSEKRHKDT